VIESSPKRSGDLPPRRTKPILVKRYARSRLYDTVSRRYVSVEQLREWANKGVLFIVRDSETDADVTRILLA
jgi:polyhydroxyalkanoate synthesis regulator protein